MVVVFGTALVLEWSASGAEVLFRGLAKHGLMQGFASAAFEVDCGPREINDSHEVSVS